MAMMTCLSFTTNEGDPFTAKEASIVDIDISCNKQPLVTSDTA